MATPWSDGLDRGWHCDCCIWNRSTFSGAEIAGLSGLRSDLIQIIGLAVVFQQRDEAGVFGLQRRGTLRSDKEVSRYYSPTLRADKIAIVRSGKA